MTVIESRWRDEPVEGSSDRNFGFVFATFFLVVACWPLTQGGVIRFWALLPSLAFLALAVAWPRLLAPFNRMWTRVGILLGKVVSPVALAVFFLSTIVPIGWLARRFGKDPLRLAWRPTATTYWIPREPAGPEPSSMKRQF